MTVQENTAALRRAVDRWNAGDLEGYLQLYDSGCLLHNPPGDLPGIEAIREFYAAFRTAFHGSQILLEEILGEGDGLACRFTVRGTHQGEFMGVSPTGREINVSGITILHFAGGKCVERWNEANFLGLLQQLGAFPPAG